MSSGVQSVMFTRRIWKDAEACKTWLSENGFKSSAYDEYDTHYTFYQRRPSEAGCVYRTTKLKKSGVRVITIEDHSVTAKLALNGTKHGRSRPLQQWQGKK